MLKFNKRKVQERNEVHQTHFKNQLSPLFCFGCKQIYSNGFTVGILIPDLPSIQIAETSLVH